MENTGSDLAKILLQNVTMGQRFTMIPDVTDNSNIDEQHRVTVHPSLEDSFISDLDSILNFESSIEGSKLLKRYRTTLKTILLEPSHEKKVRSFFRFTLKHPAEYNNSISQI